MDKSGKQFSVHDWESMIDDFQAGNGQKWLSLYPGLVILELALYTVVKRDFGLKALLIQFVEEHAHELISDADADAEEALGSMVDALKTVVQAPADGVVLTYALKEQMMVAVTSVMIAVDGLHRALNHFEGLVELLLGVINRPNHGIDRQSRAIACECLRQLEKAYPCLLHAYVGHLFVLCESERTHAIQSYVILLSTVVKSLACFMFRPASSTGSRTSAGSAASILSTSIPLVPFNTPSFLLASSSGQEIQSIPSKELSPVNIKEFRKVVSFLLERPQILTPCGMLEFVSHLMDVAEALELQVSLLKVQFSGLVYSYNPVLCHLVLMIYVRFFNSFEGEWENICRRLTLISKESFQPLIVRLLSVHWIMGLESLSLHTGRKSLITCMASSLYPSVFDPLALKAVKLDGLAYCVVGLDPSLQSVSQRSVSSLKTEDTEANKLYVDRIFNDGLTSLSAFRWLPPWRAETLLAFRMVHRFMIVATPHTLNDVAPVQCFTESDLFKTLQRLLVSTALEHQKLILSILALIDRIMHCNAHRSLGECLLQTMNEHVVSKLVPDSHLSSYFPIFERIAQNNFIPPQKLLELLTLYVGLLIQKFEQETQFKSWSRASKVLQICRTLLMHHQSSRIFLPLSRLLAFACQYFPDLEIRDCARMYLRMLVSVPGVKVRHLLHFGQQLSDDSSFLKTPSQPVSTVKPETKLLSNRIRISRVTPLIVKQSWSLVMLNSSINRKCEAPCEDAAQVEATSGINRDDETNQEAHVHNAGAFPGGTTLLVMDSKVSGLLEILRTHFSALPDFQHGSGLKVEVPCKIYFEVDKTGFAAKDDSHTSSSDSEDSCIALYALVIRFSGPPQYRAIPASRVPFLMGRSPENKRANMPNETVDQNSMLVQVRDGKSIVVAGDMRLSKIDEHNVPGTGHGEFVGDREEIFKESVVIQIEPREPTPALIDAHIDASGDDGETVHGQLQSIPVGIEDLFVKSPVPDDISEDSPGDYYSLLFNALWEACENPEKIGRETFLLSGGKKAVAIHGTGSVKLLEAQSDHVIGAVEQFLSPFVVTVSGYNLINIVKERGYIRNVVWQDEEILDSCNGQHGHVQDGPLRLKYLDDDTDGQDSLEIAKKSIGTFSILIILPPCYHLLLKMEVSVLSTLVRIRTDHWPCLAYIDEYLEVLAIK